MTKPALSFKNVSKSFDYWTERPNNFKSLFVNTFKGQWGYSNRQHIEVLNNISFEIQPGEFIAIMGRNGAGKSTILKLLCNIYQPTSGTVETNGLIAPLIALGAGFSEELSGYENIFLNAAILGFSRYQVLAQLNGIIEFSELGSKIHMPIKNYSSGMLVRLGFSIATQLTAPILLFDEVLAVGDKGFSSKCLKKIDQLHKEGRTIILVTHAPSEVKLLCERCIVIDNKTKIFDGTADEGARKYSSLF